MIRADSTITLPASTAAGVTVASPIPGGVGKSVLTV